MMMEIGYFIYLFYFIYDWFEDYKYSVNIYLNQSNFFHFFRMSELPAFHRMPFLLLCIVGMTLVTSGFPEPRLRLRWLLTKSHHDNSKL